VVNTMVASTEAAAHASALVSLSREALAARLLRRAVDLGQQAVLEARAAQDPAAEQAALDAVGAALWSRGETHEAARALSAADELRRRLGRTPSADVAPLLDLARTSPGWVARDGRGSPGSPPERGPASLTRSELEVARLVAQGLTNAQVATRLFVSVNTVKAHLRRVFTKLGVHQRSAVAAALEG
jgi:DNA-binding NarL/FixJ family response regulator